MSCVELKGAAGYRAGFPSSSTKDDGAPSSDNHNCDGHATPTSATTVAARESRKRLEYVPSGGTYVSRPQPSRPGLASTQRKGHYVCPFLAAPLRPCELRPHNADNLATGGPSSRKCFRRIYPDEETAIEFSFGEAPLWGFANAREGSAELAERADNSGGDSVIIDVEAAMAFRRDGARRSRQAGPGYERPMGTNGLKELFSCR